MSGSGRAFSLSPRLRPQLCSAPARSSQQRPALDRGSRPRPPAQIFCTFIANMPAKAARSRPGRKTENTSLLHDRFTRRNKGEKMFCVFYGDNGESTGEFAFFLGSIRSPLEAQQTSRHLGIRALEISQRSDFPRRKQDCLPEDEANI